MLNCVLSKETWLLHFPGYHVIHNKVSIKSVFDMIADDRGSQIAKRSAIVCDLIWKHTSAIVCDSAIIIADDRRR